MRSCLIVSNNYLNHASTSPADTDTMSAGHHLQQIWGDHQPQ
jgi:hypothetical protein